MKKISLIALIAIQTYALQVYPIPVELKDGKKLADFQIADDHGKYQATIKRWTQDDNGSDVLSDTTDVVVYPKIFEAPKKLKVYQKNPKPDGFAYRLILKELSVAADDSNSSVGTKIKKTLSIPVFVVPEGSETTVVTECANQMLTITNNGQIPIKLLSVGSDKFSEYLFPSHKKEVKVEAATGVIDSDHGKFEYKCTNTKNSVR
jgi:P pilus assembly chaperone PapD